mmetsp:Transcript_18606/g.27306  ORF Transcript_18606/g.27306 Transcript_18606/m.27306 type:complete len:521 (-) Transcript_18606:298-1860(-)|eukprot:CAMPEP_0195530924 /NCGR_PEP_ID=MMETSP0794_2-20130614/34047_1 /TAXON_ID=515487 /ORGANISM="Stephanopyxis turris, Strain CCMP 815" /LENGTH=520 /DNA_ID=CAMNT_0040662547 /DNA_START=86 /DNA_END=1648 /DNA_ORIENTATION=-
MVKFICSAVALVALSVSARHVGANVLVPPGGATATKRLTVDTINQNLFKMEYAVRGKVVIKADQISTDLKDEEKAKKYPFEKILYTNIGNPHSVGQKSLTWSRQVLALTNLPESGGVDHPDVLKLFPEDAVERAREMKAALGGMGSGAYSHSQGVLGFREDIAEFIKNRDGGVECDPKNLFLTNGASSGISMILTALIANEKCGAMIPIPQYPIYSASIDLLGGKQVGYYLDEQSGWDMNMKELERSIKQANADGIDVVCFVLINPGNPTGQVLSKKAVQDICKFCVKHNLVLLADEVYQENVYDEKAEFVSCKKAAADLGMIEDNSIELVSFHSTSKGLYGECGLRGGYMELCCIDPLVQDQIYKMASAGLCSNLPGQIMTSLMVRGPEPGSASFKSHEEEKKAIYDSLTRRAKIVGEGLDAIPGFSCQKAQGSMYVFPSIKMPPGAIKAAAKEGTTPDLIYALSLLEETGICVVPASGFKQKDGRSGFRTTFLPPQEDMEKAVKQIADHYKKFCEENK